MDKKATSGFSHGGPRQNSSEPEKNPSGPCKDKGRGNRNYAGRKLNFFNRDSVGFAHFHAGFTAEALVDVHDNSLAVLHFKNLDRTNIHAFAVAIAFVNINRNIPRHSILQSVLGAVLSPLFLL
jgi:hypothetical protein